MGEIKQHVQKGTLAHHWRRIAKRSPLLYILSCQHPLPSNTMATFRHLEEEVEEALSRMSQTILLMAARPLQLQLACSPLRSAPAPERPSTEGNVSTEEVVLSLRRGFVLAEVAAHSL